MNAINWIIKKAQTQTLEDGTIEYFFSGTIPANMKKQIINASTASRFHNNTTTYSDSGDVYSWAAVFGTHKNTQYNIRFSYSDYTVPANK